MVEGVLLRVVVVVIISSEEGEWVGTPHLLRRATVGPESGLWSHGYPSKVELEQSPLLETEVRFKKKGKKNHLRKRMLEGQK